MKQLTIVYQIENQEHQTALLCAPNILRVSHSDSVLELTKAAGLSLAQQNEIESLNRDKALLYDRLLQSEKSRKAAQIENEQLKERILRAGQDYKLELSKNINLQAMLNSIGAGGVESLRKNECLHQIVEPPVVDGATLAGLIASEGHLSTLVDQQRSLLVEVEDHFSRGWLGSLEDGESEIIDKVRAMIAMTNEAPQPPVVEPVPVAVIGNDWTLLFTDGDPIDQIAKKHGLKIGSLLYAQPAPVRQPLTDERIEDMESQIWEVGTLDAVERDANKELVRATEAAHGITDKS